MAIKQISDDRDFDWEEYIIDIPNDAADLPTTCGWGSRAFCISTGDIYILNSNKVWTILWADSSTESESESAGE